MSSFYGIVVSEDFNQEFSICLVFGIVPLYLNVTGPWEQDGHQKHDVLDVKEVEWQLELLFGEVTDSHHPMVYGPFDIHHRIVDSIELLP